MPTIETQRTEEAIWRRILEPEQPILSPTVVRFLLKLDFGPEDKEHMRELAAKARRGMLCSSEQEEIDAYGRAGSLLGILKSKARKFLKSPACPNGPTR